MKTITKKQFLKYEGVRISGVTNMFHITNIQEITELSKEIILIIMKNYTELAKKYLK